MTYQVGQVLFVVPTKGSARLVPIQIVEEITKKTLQGNVVSYMVKVGKDVKVLDLAQIQGEIFDTVVDAKRKLTERSIKAVIKIVDLAVNQARDWYPTYVETQHESRTETTDIVMDTQNDLQDVEEDDAFAVLDDGTRVRVQLPATLKDM